MKVAIIGSGNIGQALGGSLVKAGHKVTMAAQDELATRKIATDLGARATSSAADAARDAEIIVLAVPYAALQEVAQDIRAQVDGKVVVEVSNRMEPAAESAAELLAQVLPGARVVKAFNTNFASLLAQPDAHDQTLDSFFATDDGVARQRITALIASIGLRPVHVGGLSAARQLEAMGLLNIQLQIATQGDWRSSFVLVGAPERALTLPHAA